MKTENTSRHICYQAQCQLGRHDLWNMARKPVWQCCLFFRTAVRHPWSSALVWCPFPGLHKAKLAFDSSGSTDYSLVRRVSPHQPWLSFPGPPLFLNKQAEWRYLPHVHKALAFFCLCQLPIPSWLFACAIHLYESIAAGSSCGVCWGNRLLSMLAIRWRSS